MNTPLSVSLSDQDRTRLWERAAHCYRQAKHHGDAARCYRESKTFPLAAHLFETAGHPLEAAQCHAQAKQWPDAARCYQAAGQMVPAAECFLHAGDPLNAGWLLAHEVRHWDRAMAVLSQVPTDQATTRIALTLAQGRCQAARTPCVAVRAVMEAIQALPELTSDVSRVMQWALALAEALPRPHLTANLHAVGFRMGRTSSLRDWQSWSLSAFGMVDGLPPDPEEKEMEPASNEGEKP